MAALATDTEVITQLLQQRQMADFAKKQFSVTLDTNRSIDPDDAVEWVFTRDTAFAGVSGTIQYTRGQHITYMPMIRQLRDSGAPILPVR